MAEGQSTIERVASHAEETTGSLSDKEGPRLIGPRQLTRFERARVIGARALQIAMGAPVLLKLPPEISDPVDIANRELSEGVLPITIRRRLPDGTYQDVPIQWLLGKASTRR
ncbi:MAG: DNA-directed RNA polymerase subunit K [Candidatus Bathyarchaeia archaeon]